MPIIVPNEGAPILLQLSLGVDPGVSPGMSVHLFVNDYTPNYGTHVADMTEPTWSGYSGQSLDPTLFGIPTIISNRASITYNPGTPNEWTSGGPSPQTVYGYWIQSDDATVALFAERFATPRTVNPGDTLDLTIVLTGGTQT